MREQTEGDLVHIGQHRMLKAELLVRGPRDTHPHDREITGFIDGQVKAQSLCIDAGEAVAAKQDIGCQGADPFHLERRSSAVHKGGNIGERDALHLAVPALRADFDQPPGHLQQERGDRLDHGQDPGLQRHGGNAQGVRARHGRHSCRLHDDRGQIRVRVLWRYQQVGVPENAATRLVEQEVLERLVLGDEAGLRPQRVPGRRGNAADDHVADFALRMALHDVDDPGCVQGVTSSGSEHSGWSGNAPAFTTGLDARAD